MTSVNFAHWIINHLRPERTNSLIIYAFCSHVSCHYTFSTKATLPIAYKYGRDTADDAMNFYGFELTSAPAVGRI